MEPASHSSWRHHAPPLSTLTVCTALTFTFAVAAPATASTTPTDDDIVQAETTGVVTPALKDGRAEGSDINGNASQSLNTTTGTLTIDPAPSSGASSVSIDLPTSAAIAPKPLADGTIDLTASPEGSSTYVQFLTNGDTRTITSISDEHSPTSFTYTVSLTADQEITSTSGGGVVIAEHTSDTTMTEVASASAPWAMDALGRDLPTWYEVDGNAITQHVDTAGATFPVIADPQWSRSGVTVTVPGFGGAVGSVYMNKLWSNDFSNGNTAVCGIAAALLALGSGLGGAVLGAGCAAQAGIDSILLNHGYCVALDIRLPHTVTHRFYRNSWCR